MQILQLDYYSSANIAQISSCTMYKKIDVKQ